MNLLPQYTKGSDKQDFEPLQLKSRLVSAENHAALWSITEVSSPHSIASPLRKFVDNSFSRTRARRVFYAISLQRRDS